MTDTRGLPYEIIFAVGKIYVITANIDVTDSLANGAVEAELRNEELFEIENFKRITQYRRPSINCGRWVAIYQNVHDSLHKFIGNHDDF
ncbi:hypothetical protein TNIN_63801 [Trichonephila inaurata madagascariensis]|uniref:Uncharacterized protein n=1 Tax=Trichonephila inaurata madagascariensis TaxID=2747483 RepID=A0A8X6YU60_9ARAC|nr:hypothetical protein TNIN_63801 [Trichonephila inaurata madagascariensis]